MKFTKIVVVGVALLLSACSSTVSAVPKKETQISKLQCGGASWYALHGRRTASGEKMNMHANTAAHKTLPFGSKVKVTNQRNGKSVVVRINDRGPFIRGRKLDLSKAAAHKIGIVSSGHGQVCYHLVK